MTRISFRSILQRPQQPQQHLTLQLVVVVVAVVVAVAVAAAVAAAADFVGAEIVEDD